MGTDIHAAVEIFDGKRWRAQLWPNPWYGKYNDENPTSYNMHLNRNYDLFAILANIRNCEDGGGYAYIQEERGVPKDVSAEARAVLSNEHSAGWVTLSELLDFDWSRTIKFENDTCFYAEAVGQFYTRWIPKMVKLAKDAGVRPEYLRIVFDFDS